MDGKASCFQPSGNSDPLSTPGMVTIVSIGGIWGPTERAVHLCRVWNKLNLSPESAFRAFKCAENGHDRQYPGFPRSYGRVLLTCLEH